MDSALRSRLHDLTLSARRLLTDETAQLLEGVYGLHSDGHFESAEKLPAVQMLPEAAWARAWLERLLEDERAAGLTPRQATAKLVKEVAYTWLNRVAAFKMLEARKLIRLSVSKGQQSSGFMLWLTEPGHEDDYARYEAGSLPVDVLGEGPRDAAYRHYLLALCGQMAAQVRALFDPDTLPSRLFPRARALTDLLMLVNADDVAAAWGDDETIGWIYQYFNEQEKAEVFAKLGKGAKITTSEIPAATQLFTPRWIVRALVENSLGRLWLQMHPDSSLHEQLAYLIPEVEAPAAAMKPVREITLLDPACGTMHFGLVAFDLFAAMYQEEIEHAGEPGWPEQPSATDASKIASAIVEHNLFGIDIDERAVQLSALTLLLKATSLNPKATLRQSNLACADVLLLNGNRLDAFLAEMRFERPIFERVIRAVWKRLRDANQLGSLLRLEDEIRGLVHDERERYQRERAGRLPFKEYRGTFEEAAGEDEYWQIIETQIIQAFDEFARQQARAGIDQTYFTGEATKGMRLLEVMLRRYDVVGANPPYMTSRNMSPAMNAYLKADYPNAKGDLYAAFINRCADMLAPGGRMAMITQQSFMFISSYESLRAYLRKTVAIEAMIHVGPRAFAEIGGEKVNTTIFVLRAEPDTIRRDNSMGTYIRLVREPDAGAKQRGYERALAAMRNAAASQPAAAGFVADREGGHPGADSSASRNVYRYRQGDFDAIPGSPWVYWITPGLRKLFKTLPKLGEIGEPKVGLQTGENFRFLRYWWEVGPDCIGFGYHDGLHARASRMRWFPYMKGGEFQRWWGNQEYIVNWANDGEEMKAFTPAVIRNPGYYFRRGVTWTDLTSGRFSARLSPGGFIFDVAGSSCFPDDVLLVLGIMTSTWAQYALNLINPTVHVQVGDLARLPIPTRSSETLRGLVERAIALSRAESAEDETTYEFVAPPVWPVGLARVASRHDELAAVEHEIDEEVYRLYAISPADRAAIEAELSLASEPDTDAEDEGENGDEDGENGLAAPSPNPSPVRRGESDGLADGRGDLARRWVSYAVGIVLGRFQPGMDGALGNGIAALPSPEGTPDAACAAWQALSSDIAKEARALVVSDSIATLEAGHPDDLAGRVTQALGLLVGDDHVETLLSEATGGKPLADYLAGDFFKAHVKQYRKRPIYWLLQSSGRGAKRRYSVYLFSERITRDTLHLVRGGRYVAGRIARLRKDAGELRQRIHSLPQGAERRRAERDLDALDGELADLEAFDKALAEVTNRPNQRGETAGWAPELDDGILINLAPLASLLPAWAAEPKQCWEALARGEYDWSHTAMRYWPDRVRDACRTNKSYAIAHGIDV